MTKLELNFVKTHNCLLPFKEMNLHHKNETLGAIYIVRDPRNVITSITHHYSINYEKALDYMLDDDCSLLEKSFDQDYSNFTYLNHGQIIINHGKIIKILKYFL